MLIAATAATGIGAAPPAPLRPEVPVMVGGYDDLDACLSAVRVTGLDPKGDNYLSLRSRPSAKARELARLPAGQIMSSCARSRDGMWTGVVYNPSGDPLDCGTGTPIARRQPYRGPCASGWVATRFIVVIAG